MLCPFRGEVVPASRQPRAGCEPATTESQSTRIAAVRARVAELRSRAMSPQRLAAEADGVSWPTDLSSGQTGESEWGADPEEVVVA